VHDAVAHTEGRPQDAGQTMVDEVLRSGYRWKGLVLRPTMVRVRG
jgi:molecular chaperone GrpE (heat shock protein)